MTNPNLSPALDLDLDQPRTSASQESVPETWQTDEALIALAAAQALPEDTPGRDTLLEEAEQVRESAQNDIARFDLNPDDPNVRRGIKDGVLTYDEAERKVVGTTLHAEDLRSKEYSEDERVKLLIYGFFVNHFNTQKRVADLQEKPVRFSEQSTGLLREALIRKVTDDPASYEAAAALQVLKTRHLLK